MLSILAPYIVTTCNNLYHITSSHLFVTTIPSWYQSRFIIFYTSRVGARAFELHSNKLITWNMPQYTPPTVPPPNISIYVLSHLTWFHNFVLLLVSHPLSLNLQQSHPVMSGTPSLPTQYCNNNPPFPTQPPTPSPPILHIPHSPYTPHKLS